MRRHLVLSLLLLAAQARLGVAGAVAETPGDAGGAATETEDAAPAVQLVQVWPKTKQALMFDPNHGTYVVVAVGQTVAGYRVVRIGKRQITLADATSTGPGHEFVLLPTPVDPEATAPGAIAPTPPTATPTTPAAPPAGSGAPGAEATAPAAAAPPAPALLDPYPSDVLDPYGSNGMRVVLAPPDQRVSDTAGRAPSVTPAPAVTAPAPPPASTATNPTPASTPATSTAPAPIPSPAPTTTAPVPSRPGRASSPGDWSIPSITPTTSTTPTTAPTRPSRPPSTTPSTPTPAADKVVLSRRELDAALSDFARLTRDSQLALGTGGVSFARVAPGSLFARVGLRDGDRITAINGVTLRSIDDAAGLYARLASLDHLAIDVVRGASKLTLRCELTR